MAFIVLKGYLKKDLLPELVEKLVKTMRKDFKPSLETLKIPTLKSMLDEQDADDRGGVMTSRKADDGVAPNRGQPRPHFLGMRSTAELHPKAS